MKGKLKKSQDPALIGEPETEALPSTILHRISMGQVNGCGQSRVSCHTSSAPLPSGPSSLVSKNV